MAELTPEEKKIMRICKTAWKTYRADMLGIYLHGATMSAIWSCDYSDKDSYSEICDDLDWLASVARYT